MPGRNEAPPLEVKDLVKTYGGLNAVDGVSFTVPPGKVFCLLGQNGAGKTTTLETAQGMRKPTSGTIRIFGEDPWNAGPALKRRIGTLPQHFVCFDQYTVRENLQYFADMYDVSPDIDAIITSLGLTESADKLYKTLSGGTKRRVGIATALVNEPDLLFLDEPTAGVDPASRRQLWEVIETLRAGGRSIVLTTHYMDEAEHLADDVAIIAKGRIIARGTPEEVRLKHGGGTFVRITGFTGDVPGSLRTRPGVQVTPEGVLTIPLANASEGPLVLAEVVKSGLQYQELSIREPSLDDAFVRLVAPAKEEA